MLRTRLITAAIGIPILLGIIYLGGLYWQGFILLLTIVALFEYLGMMRSWGFNPIIIPALWIAIVLLFRADLEPNLAGLFFIGFLLMILTMIFKYPRVNHNDLTLSMWGAIYTGFFFSFGLAITELGEPFYLLLLVFILTWASDVGGYFVGRRWGKNKLSPQLSPGKTWEGAGGALLFTVVAAIVYHFFWPAANLGISKLIILGLTASLAAQMGDLLESALKRFFGVKDSGKIIPGHGGVLDRFDSFMLVLPVVYYFMVVCI